MNTRDYMLLVDDSPGDIELTLEALRTYKFVNEVVILNDGAEALDYLYRRGTYSERTNIQPAVILLDLNMPKLSGLDVLLQVKVDPELKIIPVIMMTSSNLEQDLIRSYQLGVNAYVIKPLKFHEFSGAVKIVADFWAVLNEPPPEKLRRFISKDAGTGNGTNTGTPD